MAAKLYGYVTGMLYILVAVYGFVWTGFHAWIEPDTGVYLLGLRLNPTHNLAHLVLGVTLLWAATEELPVARIAVAIVGAVFVALGIAGFWATGHPDWNVLALNTADNWLHLATGAVALLTAAWPTARVRTL